MINIENFMDIICDCLNIGVPKITEAGVSEMPTKTMPAMYLPDEDKIIYKAPNEILDLFFAMAHELRHKWQFQYHPDKYFSDYKPREKVDLETYNLQSAEVDANAFAKIACVNLLGVAPLFNGYPDNVKVAIEKRIPEILEGA